MIADRPDSAYDVCTKFAPDCAGEHLQSVASKSAGTRPTSHKKEKKSNSRNAVSSDQAHVSIDSSLNSNLGRSSSIRNLGLTSSDVLKFNTDATLVSRDNSAESDDLGGVSLHGEEDYYDSLNSGDELSNPRPNNTRTAYPLEPVYNPEPGVNFEPIYNPEPGINENDVDTSYKEVSENDSSSVFMNTTAFSTVVNGVRIKSLPGPRGRC